MFLYFSVQDGDNAFKNFKHAVTITILAEKTVFLHSQSHVHAFISPSNISIDLGIPFDFFIYRFLRKIFSIDWVERFSSSAWRKPEDHLVNTIPHLIG